MNNSAELQNYIKDSLRQGDTEEYIRTTLRRNGWSDDLINIAFANIKPNAQTVDLPPTDGAEITVSSSPVESVPTKPLEIAMPVEEKRKSFRTLGILAMMIFLVLIFFLVIRPELQHKDKMSQQEMSKTDLRSRDELDTLASRLEDYYTAEKSYPTQTQLKKLSWSNVKPAYSYIASGESGDSCDAEAIPCSRIVLNTKLNTEKYYVLVLDKNKFSGN